MNGRPPEKSTSVLASSILGVRSPLTRTYTRVPTRLSRLTTLPLASLVVVRSEAMMAAAWSPGSAPFGTRISIGVMYAERAGTVTWLRRSLTQDPRSVERLSRVRASKAPSGVFSASAG
ncbi:hypothetical protein [Kineosporia sp. A_224]|uniref:hypothetical protein n=1 Tax=Kineosporia sp. A_224 TaxID=1962180 RepID=UPI00117B79CA|nr:hypothetical protein [Kineosporia sp. A_224]